MIFQFMVVCWKSLYIILGSGTYLGFPAIPAKLRTVLTKNNRLFQGDSENEPPKIRQILILVIIIIFEKMNFEFRED